MKKRICGGPKLYQDFEHILRTVFEVDEFKKNVYDCLAENIWHSVYKKSPIKTSSIYIKKTHIPLKEE